MAADYVTNANDMVKSWTRFYKVVQLH